MKPSKAHPTENIAKAHGIPEATLRRLAKKYAWVRGAPEIKRRIVADHFAGMTKGLTNDEVRQNQEGAASEDIADMECGLRIHRHCLLLSWRGAGEIDFEILTKVEREARFNPLLAATPLTVLHNPIASRYVLIYSDNTLDVRP